MSKKESITIHGQIADLLNYKALIEAQSKTETSLGKPPKQKIKERKGQQFLKHRPQNFD